MLGRNAMYSLSFIIIAIALWLSSAPSNARENLEDKPLQTKQTLLIPTKSVEIGGQNAGSTGGMFRSGQIIVSTGNKIEQERDFTSSGERPLSLSRIYNHFWQGVGIFGKYWVSNYDYKLTFGSTAINACYPRPGGGSCSIGANTVIYAWRPDGRTIKFVKQADGDFYEDKPSPLAKIVQQPDGTFQHQTEANELEIYTASGYISKVVKHNVGWTFAYTNTTYPYRVTHTSGRYVEFTWTSGQLVSVRDPNGSYYGFSYNANKFGTGLHRLVATSKPGTPASSITYHYESTSDASALTGKSLSGVRFSKFTYDTNGRATSSEKNGFERYTYSYTVGSNGLLTVLETNPILGKTTYAFQDGKLTSTTSHPSTYAAGGTSLVEYDVNGYPAMTSDFNNNKTAYTYNAKGQMLQKTEAYNTPLARTIVYEWWGPAAQNKLLSETIAGHKKTIYYYDALARIARISTTNLSVNGVANQTRDTWITYETYGISLPNGVMMPGMLKSVTIDGPVSGSDDFTKTSFDSLGNLTSTNNSLNHVTTYSGHNGLGLPSRMTGINGELIDYTYDAQGRVTNVRTYPNGSTPADRAYTYASNGTISSISAPGGIYLTYLYDAALRLSQKSGDAAGVLVGGAPKEQELYGYDLANNLTSIFTKESSGPSGPGGPGGGGTCNPICVDPQSVPNSPMSTNEAALMTVTSAPAGTVFGAYFDYDEIGRSRGNRGNNGQNIRYTYDLNGNVKTVTDSKNHVTTMEYDALNRLVRSVDSISAPNGTTFEYDLSDRPQKVTDPRGKSTIYVYDGFGQLWAQNSPDTGTTTYQYNPAGQLTVMTRNDGSALSYTYDGLGRLTWYGNSQQGRAYGYDWCSNGKGKLCNADHNNGTRHFGYSVYGQVTITRDWTPTSDEWSGYSYDSSGRLAGISYPSGVSVGYGYSAGKVVLAQATINGVTKNIISNIKYRAFGDTASWTYGNGLSRSMARDLDGRMTSILTSGVQGLSYQYNENNEVSVLTNTWNQTYNHSYAYDARSRLVSHISQGGSSTTNDGFDSVGNRTARTSNLIGGFQYQIDPASNRMMGVTGAETREFTYDGRGNRAWSHHHGYHIASYFYDPFNRYNRVDYFNGSTSTRTDYAYNAFDQRISKNNPSLSSRFVSSGQNQLMTEYTNGVWTSYLWMGGKLIGLVRNNTLYFVHNDRQGRPEVVTNEAQQQVWRASNTPYTRTILTDGIGGLNLGYPGQYLDSETGLWHNGMRDYDSAVGRYTQSDPIGLSGGLNTYSYVDNNPISAVDPTGLQSDPTDNLIYPPSTNCSFTIDCRNETLAPGGGPWALGVACSRTTIPVIGGIVCNATVWMACGSIHERRCRGDYLPPYEVPRPVIPPVVPVLPTTVVTGPVETPVGIVDVGELENVADNEVIVVYDEDGRVGLSRGGGAGSIIGGRIFGGGTVIVHEPEPADEDEE